MRTNGDPDGYQATEAPSAAIKNKNDYRVLGNAVSSTSLVSSVNGFLVPNVAHFIRFNAPNVSFVDMLCIKAALRNIRPDKLYIHCDAAPRGRYWDMVKSDVIVNHLARPRRAYGRRLSNENQELFARLEILKKYGGIFLDNDVLVLKSLDKYRKYEFTLGWPDGEHISTKILISSRTAKFLNVIHKMFSLDDLDRSKITDVVTKQVLWEFPELVHAEPTKLGVQNLCYDIFYGPLNWRNYDALNLMYSHRYYLTPEDPIKEHSENNIKNLTTPFGEIARLLYYGSEKVAT